MQLPGLGPLNDFVSAGLYFFVFLVIGLFMLVLMCFFKGLLS